MYICTPRLESNMTKTSYKTISANNKTVNKEWVLVDAAKLPLGRTASIVATLLRLSLIHI